MLCEGVTATLLAEKVAAVLERTGLPTTEADYREAADAFNRFCDGSDFFRGEVFTIVYATCRMTSRQAPRRSTYGFLRERATAR